MSNKNKKTQQTHPPVKPPHHKKQTLSEIFREQPTMGWDVLDDQSKLYCENDVTIDKITHLTQYYMRIIEKLNSLQDPRELYFTDKMQKLMSKPYVIRCFDSQQKQQNTALQARRKQLEQRIQKQSERQNHKAIIEQVLQAQKEKEKRMINTVKNAVEQIDKRLEERIKRRNLNRLERSMDMSPSHSLDNSMYSERRNSFTGKNRFDNIFSSTDFEMMISEEQQFRRLKSKIEQEQEEQQLQFKLGILKKERESQSKKENGSPIHRK